MSRTGGGPPAEAAVAHRMLRRKSQWGDCLGRQAPVGACGLPNEKPFVISTRACVLCRLGSVDTTIVRARIRRKARGIAGPPRSWIQPGPAAGVRAGTENQSGPCGPHTERVRDGRPGPETNRGEARSTRFRPRARLEPSRPDHDRSGPPAGSSTPPSNARTRTSPRDARLARSRKKP